MGTETEPRRSRRMQRLTMGDEPPPQPGGPRDVAQHLRDYQNFVRGLRWAVAVSAIVLILLAYFLV